MMTNTLPTDPFILLSFVNTKLRDNYDSLAAMCDDMNIDANVIVNTLRGVGYEYDEKLNKFI